MLTRKLLPQPQEKDWFMFSAGLMLHVSSDYIAMRLLHQLEPLTSMPTICVLMLDVVEKALKLHLAVQTQTATALTDMATKYGHNVEALREACAGFAPVFADPDVRDFAKHLNDRDGKLYQQLRYGSQKTTEGFSTNLSTLRPVVDKIFCESILQLPESIRRVLVYSSPLKHLIVGNRFDQSRHPAGLLEALRRDNAYFDALSDYCHRIEKEQSDLLAKMTATQQPQTDA
ncbi:MAG: hypothetical protein HYS18_14500 [Burkholderiales bacterium]|nr:hypothetical protein [Burkholderiales bacterium]